MSPPDASTIEAGGHQLDVGVLLDRPEVDLDVEMADLRNANVLITGAAGCVGRELVRLLTLLPGTGQIVLAGRLNDSLREWASVRRHGGRLELVDTDVRNGPEMRRAFGLEGDGVAAPRYVFHLASSGTSSIVEAQQSAREAFANNVEGTVRVARLALEAGTPILVRASSERAARPSPFVLRQTDALANRVLSGLNKDGTQFGSVRLANVLGSRGSRVIDNFVNQLLRDQVEGERSQVAHHETRVRLVTASEMAQLLLYAATNAGPGVAHLPVFAGPVKTEELARRVGRALGVGIVEPVPGPRSEFFESFGGLYAADDQILPERADPRVASVVVPSIDYDKLVAAVKSDVTDNETFRRSLLAFVSGGIADEMDGLHPPFGPT